jgi:hypothetical protein
MADLFLPGRVSGSMSTYGCGEMSAQVKPGAPVSQPCPAARVAADRRVCIFGLVVGGLILLLLLGGGATALARQSALRRQNVRRQRIQTTENTTDSSGAAVPLVGMPQNPCMPTKAAEPEHAALGLPVNPVYADPRRRGRDAGVPDGRERRAPASRGRDGAVGIVLLSRGPRSVPS